MKKTNWKMLIFANAIYIAQVFHSIAGTTTNTNNLVVLGFIDATNDISYGTLTNGAAAVYHMFTNNSVEWGASQISTAFYWQDNLTNTPRAKMQLDGTNNLSIYSTNGIAGVFLNPNAGSLTLSGSNSGVNLSASNATITLSGSNSSIALSGTNSKLFLSGSGSGITLNGANSSITLVDGTVLSNAASLRGAGLYQVGSTNPYESIGTNGVVSVTGSGVTFTGTNGNTGVTLNPNTGGITLAGTNSVINLSGSNSAITLSGSNSSITLSDGTVLSNAASLRASALYQFGSNNPYESIGTNGVVGVTGSGVTFTGTNGNTGVTLNPNTGGITLTGANSGLTLTGSNAAINLSGVGSGITLSGSNSSITLSDGTVLSNAASLKGSGLYQIGSTNPYESIGTNGVVNVAGSAISFTGTNGNTGVILNPNTGGITLSGTNSSISLGGTNSVINLSGSNSAITLSGSNSSITLSDGTVLSNAVSLRASALYQSGATNPFESIGTNGVVGLVGSGMIFTGTNSNTGVTLNPNTGGITLAGTNSGLTLTGTNASILMSGSNSSIALNGTNSGLQLGGVGSGITLSGSNSTIKLTGSNSSISLADGTILNNAASLRGTGLYQNGSTNPYESIGTNGVVSVTGSGITFTGTNGNTGVTLNPNTGGITLAGTNSIINLSGSNSAITLSGSNSSITLSDGTALSNAASLRTSALYQYGSNNPYESIGTNGVVSMTGSGLTFGNQNTTPGMNGIALGVHTIAASISSMAIGQYNVGISTTNSSNTTWITNDSVLEVGNGSSTSSSNAVTIFKSGKLRTAGTIESQAGIRVPQTGDLSMGVYTNGNNPATLVPSTGLLYPNGQ